MKLRVMIADDHSMVRQGLRMYLTTDPQMEVVGEATDGVEAVQLAQALRPDVVLMDLIMPGMDGITASRAICAALPQTAVIALTSVTEESAVHKMLQAGAVGYLLKTSKPEELCQAIRAAASRGKRCSPKQTLRGLRKARSSRNAEMLTSREAEILSLIGQGKSNKEIAMQLHVGETTVKTHVSRILGKLGVPSRTQAALYAVRQGLATNLSPGD